MCVWGGVVGGEQPRSARRGAGSVWVQSLSIHVTSGKPLSLSVPRFPHLSGVNAPLTALLGEVNE